MILRRRGKLAEAGRSEIDRGALLLLLLLLWGGGGGGVVIFISPPQPTPLPTHLHRLKGNENFSPIQLIFNEILRFHKELKVYFQQIF